MTDKIKSKIINIMFSTCLALILIAVFAVIIGYKTTYVNTIFEVFAANIVIHLGLVFTKKFESSYAILEYVLDVSYIIVVLIIFGLIFNWFSSIPIWYLIIMAVFIYAFGIFINIAKIRKESDELNKLLQKRKNKNTVT